jgi:repressor LexA
MQGLTRRQEQTLDFIRRSIEQRGYPPTLREIGQYMGIRSTNGVNDHLRALERKGYLRREDMKSRALRLVEDLLDEERVEGPAGGDAGYDEVDFRGLPPGDVAVDGLVDIAVVGRVAAGLPLLAEENVIDTLKIDRMMVRGGRDVFGLRVIGDSMVEAGILSGDYVFVRRQSTADRGSIVVALIGDEATVKYYFPERDYVRFQPANSRMAPILVRAMDFKPTMLLGKVIGVFRRL